MCQSALEAARRLEASLTRVLQSMDDRPNRELDLVLNDTKPAQKGHDPEKGVALD
jgi:hypothetical protein